MFCFQAGSQYLDCTTDITRTHHFGTPTDLEKRAYTRVLQGVLDLADAVFPVGTFGRSLDYLARMHLFRDGMTFGHSVGCVLTLHRASGLSRLLLFVSQSRHRALPQCARRSSTHWTLV